MEAGGGAGVWGGGVSDGRLLPHARPMTQDLVGHLEFDFWQKVGKGAGSCWQWRGPTHRGYGKMWDALHGRPWFVHRLSYVFSGRPIPAGLTVDHLCSNRACVRWDHLELVSQTENVRRGYRRMAKQGATHCKHGHEFTPENTYIRPNRPTERECRVCKRRRKREEGRK